MKVLVGTFNWEKALLGAWLWNLRVPSIEALLHNVGHRARGVETYYRRAQCPHCSPISRMTVRSALIRCGMNERPGWWWDDARWWCNGRTISPSCGESPELGHCLQICGHKKPGGHWTCSSGKIPGTSLHLHFLILTIRWKQLLWKERIIIAN